MPIPYGGEVTIRSTLPSCHGNAPASPTSRGCIGQRYTPSWPMQDARAGERKVSRWGAVPVSGSPIRRAGHEQAERSSAPAASAKASGDATVDHLVLMLRGAPTNCAPLAAQMLQRELHHVRVEWLARQRRPPTDHRQRQRIVFRKCRQYVRLNVGGGAQATRVPDEP